MWSTSGQMHPSALSSVSSLTGKPEPEETEKAKARNRTRPGRPGPRSHLNPAASKSCQVKTQILAPATKCADLGFIRHTDASPSDGYGMEACTAPLSREH